MCLRLQCAPSVARTAAWIRCVLQSVFSGDADRSGSLAGPRKSCRLRGIILSDAMEPQVSNDHVAAGGRDWTGCFVGAVTDATCSMLM